eukprot:scaffold11310_cov107-Isochrysis_galbana.AAC.8
MFKRQRLTELVLSSDYVLDLVKLFRVAEDLESSEDLHHIYHIFKGLVLLNDGGLYELLLRHDLVMDVFGALEYDPEVGAGRRADHRDFFEGGKRFKLVVPITDDAVLKKIHQNYHIGFLKDVVLPRALDDNAFAALNQIAFCNNVHIVSALANDRTFFQTLRDKLADEAQEPGALLDALRLLQELCTIAKQLQLYNRSAFYRKFCEHACFAPLAAALRRPQPEIRLAALEILLASTQHEPSLLRQFILGQRPEYEMCHALISVLATPGGSGEKPQVTEVLRALLDPEGMEGREKDDFLNTFYEEFVDKVAQPVTGKVAAGTGPVNGNAAAANGSSAVGVDEGDVDGGDVGDVLSARQHVCELLSFFVTKHTHRIKYFILRNNVLCRVLKLARASDKGLVLAGTEPLLLRSAAWPRYPRCLEPPRVYLLTVTPLPLSPPSRCTAAAIRFFRTCVGLKDEFYNRYIVKHRCFEPLIAQLRANIGRDNLVHSAILELLEFVRRENIRSLVSHLAEVYAEPFGEFKHVDVFNGIMLRHAQNSEAGGEAGPAIGPAGVAAGPGTANCAPPPGGRRIFGGDDDDAYFNESDEDEEAPAAAAAVEPIDDRQFVPRPISAATEDAPEREVHRVSAGVAPRLPAVLELQRRSGATSPPLGHHPGSPPWRSPPGVPASPPRAPIHGSVPGVALPPAASSAAVAPRAFGIPSTLPTAQAVGTTEDGGDGDATSLVPAYDEEKGQADGERLVRDDAEALARKRQRVGAVAGGAAGGEGYA